MQYHDYLKSDYWKSVRDAAKKRDGYRCKFCSRTNELAVHHNSYAHLGREIDFLDDVICVCGVCHNTLHQVMKVNGVMRPTVMPVKWIQPAGNYPVAVYSRSKPSKKELRQMKIEARAQRRRENKAKRLQNAEGRTRHQAELDALNRKVASLYDHNADMPKSFPFLIDRTFLVKLRTLAGGYTSRTLTAIGVCIPPVTGWPDRLIGSPLTEEQCRMALNGRECKSTIRTLNRRASYSPAPLIALAQ